MLRFLRLSCLYRFLSIRLSFSSGCDNVFSLPTMSGVSMYMPFRPPVVDRSTRYRYRRYSHPSVFCNPVNFFRLFPLPSRPRSSRSPLFYFFLLSIHQPFFLSSRSLLYSPPTCRSYLFFRTPPYSCLLHRHPRSPFSFFTLPPAPTPSSFLLLYSSSSFTASTTPLLFLGFLFFLHHLAYLMSSLSLSLSILLYPLALLYNLLPLFFIFYIYFYVSLSSFIFSHLLLIVYALIRS